MKQMPPTTPLLSSEFGRLLDRLAADIIDAAVFRHLLADLRAIFDAYRREFNESHTFWYLSFQAYSDVVLNRLGRVYVGQKDALSLGRWLEAIKNSPQLFPPTLDTVQLDRDIASVGNKDPLVNKLICLRGNFLAHINWDHAAGGGMKIKDEKFDLTWVEMHRVISRATEILNRYSILFNRTSWSMEIAGRHDYKSILNAVRSDLERMDADIAADSRIANEVNTT
jgi:AbiU2